MSLQVCHCGWSKCTTYHGLRVHQGKMGCTPKGMRIPESEQFRFSNNLNYLGPQIKIHEPFVPVVKSPVDVYKSPVDVYKSPVDVYKSPVDVYKSPVDVYKSPVDSLFETPRHSQKTTVSRINDSGARRVLNFSFGGQQAAQFSELPAAPALKAETGPTVREMEKNMEKDKTAKKLQKAKQEKMKADLQKKIHIRELKMAEVRSSIIDCKARLDAECKKVNNIFSDMVKVVEDARQKALKPLEERRWKVKREEQDIIAKLQREIDALKEVIDESDRNPDLEVSPLTGLSDSDWKDVCVDTSVSFGTLRAVTSAMMKQIQQEIEKLSSIDLRRISAFPVDVKLDPATAHQSLVLSVDGKEVSDVGRTAEGPDSPQRFDMFGSVLGLNRLTSGKSYWEVEVRNKTGWDLGVARRDANRKGILSLIPDNGYWVTVHYEDKKYAALTAPPVSLSLKKKPQKVGVFVDYEEGLVSFYDVTSQSHIFSFTECEFGGEILPYFSPHLKRNEKNTDPLIISAVRKQI